jgi:hypothetical protein
MASVRFAHDAPYRRSPDLHEIGLNSVGAALEFNRTRRRVTATDCQNLGVLKTPASSGEQSHLRDCREGQNTTDAVQDIAQEPSQAFDASRAPGRGLEQ